MGAGSLTIVYPLDYARTRLASDVGSGKKSFSGLGDCIMKTMKGPGGFLALYTGFGVSVVGIVGYRGLQLGCFDTITGLNPWRSTCTRAPETASRRSPRRRAWRRVCTRVSWRMWCAVWVARWCLSSTTARRTPWACEAFRFGVLQT